MSPKSVAGSIHRYRRLTSPQVRGTKRLYRVTKSLNYQRILLEVNAAIEQLSGTERAMIPASGTLPERMIALALVWLKIPFSAQRSEDGGRTWSDAAGGFRTDFEGAPGSLAVDLMYGPPAQGFLDWAAAAGARPRDGLGMLVEQAAEAFFVWRGVHPLTAPVLQALRDSLASPA